MDIKNSESPTSVVGRRTLKIIDYPDGTCLVTHSQGFVDRDHAAGYLQQMQFVKRMMEAEDDRYEAEQAATGEDSNNAR